MKSIIIISLLIFANPIFSQASVTESKSFEELYQLGEINAIKSYRNDLPNAITGFFFGSLAIDVTSAVEFNDFKIKRMTSNLDLDEAILNNEWFLKGFISKRK